MPSYLVGTCNHCGKDSILLDITGREPFQVHVSMMFRTPCPYCQKEFGGLVADCKVLKSTQAVQPPNK